MNFFKKAKKGFTLVELVVVIAVIAILAAVSVGAYFGVTESANNSRAEQEAKQAYTQLQTKTLAGLDLGSSGTSVTLGNKGLTFNGIYDSNTLNLLGDLVFDQGVEYDVVALDTVASVGEETTENATVYFLADNTTGSVVAEYMGYVPANLSKKYVKYLNLANGEFTKVEDITKTYKNEILPANLVKEVINWDSFTETANKNISGVTYKSYGDSIDGNYFGFGNVDDDTIANKWLQFSGKRDDGNLPGIYSKNAQYKLAYVGIKWANYDKNIGKSITIKGTSATPYSSYVSSAVESITEKDGAIINYGETLVPVTENIAFSRLATTSAVYVEEISYYYDNTAAVGELELSSLTINGLGDYIKTLDTFTLTFTATPLSFANTPVIWTSSNESVAEINETTGEVTPKTYGKTTFTVTSALFPSFSDTYEVEFINETTLKAGYAYKLADIGTSTDIIVTNTDYKVVMGGLNSSNNYRNYISYENNSNITEEDYSLSFLNTIGVGVLHAELDTASNAYTLQSTITDKYLYHKGSSNHLYEGTLDEIDEAGGQELWEISFDEDGNAIIKVKDNADNRQIMYNSTVTDKSDNRRFSTYKGTEKPVQIYVVGQEVDRNPSSLNISTPDSYVNVGGDMTISVNLLPSFAEMSTPLSWIITPSENASIEGTTLKGLKAGVVTIKACFGAIESNELQITVISPDAPKNGYYLIESSEEIELGETYVIAGASSNIAMTKDAANYYDNRAGANIERLANTINFEQYKVEEFVLVQGYKEGTVAFQLEDGISYLTLVPSGANANLKLSNEVNEYSSWKVEVNDNGEIHITCAVEDESIVKRDMRTYFGKSCFNLSEVEETHELVSLYRSYGEITYIPHVHDFEGNNSIEFCDCGEKNGNYVAPAPSNNFDALTLTFGDTEKDASGDTYMKTNYSSWLIEGKLGKCYAGYLGFGKDGGTTSSITSPSFAFTSNFKLSAVIKGNGSNGVMTSTLTFTLIDENNNVVANGYANGSSTVAFAPENGKDTTYEIVFTFNEGKTIADATNLNIAFAKVKGNIGLKSLTASAI